MFRIDVDFDPNIDPVSLVKETYLNPRSIDPYRCTYTRKNGVSFTAPRLSFQRLTGRYDEPALFSSAASQLRLFADRAEGALKRAKAPVPEETKATIEEARSEAAMIDLIATHYFNFGSHQKEGRNNPRGVMTRDTYTKAAHLACLKEMIPEGKLTLVGEQEAAMARVVPHVFRDEILSDLFEWHVISFDKKAKKGQILERTNKFDRSFRAFRTSNPELSIPEALRKWTGSRLTAAFRTDESGAPTPFPGSNFASKAFPALWITSPIQVGGETNKVVGFPILSPRYREKYRLLKLDDATMDADLNAAIARRVINATLQPASTFMNALRERISFAQRAGGRSNRSGGTYVNGACYNPRILIALLNIFRVHYNFFELRQYVSAINKHEETAYVAQGTTSIAVPGSSRRIEVPQRRRLAPVKRTPAMRAGIHGVDRNDEKPKVPQMDELLYEPWLFHGTPLWDKLKD